VPKTNEKVEWLKPVAVAEVEFAEWTDDGRMRQPIFMGLRPDKDPKDCVQETAGETGSLVRAAESHAPAGKRSKEAELSRAKLAAPKRSEGWPEFTNLEKVYWPGEGRTKGDLIAYYDAVSPWLLPHLKDRPLILKRFPDGIERPPFFQHDIKHPPPRLKTVVVPEDDGTEVRYALCQDRESLLWLANLGVIPLHPWLSRAPHLHRPDHIVFDLDPGEVPFEEVTRMAVFLGGLLESLGLIAFPKTSGSKGMHVYVPLKPAYTFVQSLGFAQLVAEWAVGQMPDAFTVERSLKLRKKDRIYLDCMQNSEGKSVAAVYSARERPGGTVSAPLAWSEVRKGIRREDFTMDSMPARLKKKGDLFADVLKAKNSLEAPLKKLERMLKDREVPA
jgi:bifunctional non-homologous end joining protein LigD